MKKILAVALSSALLLPGGATPALAQHFARTVAPTAPVVIAPVGMGVNGASLSRPSASFAPAVAPTLRTAPSPVLPTAVAQPGALQAAV
ncbi:MAG: hypothetical protein FD126_3022, partial [Elusimicrobia bacterium]